MPLVQGLASAVFGLLTLSIRISISVLITQRSKSGYVAATEEHPARQPKLVSCLAQLRVKDACKRACSAPNYTELSHIGFLSTLAWWPLS